MAVNKVQINTENGVETLIDLTGDTVTPETLAEGTTAHDASGNVITGTMQNVDNETIAEITRHMERVTVYEGGCVNLLDQDSCAFGYVSEQGTSGESTSLKYTPHIPVTEGDIIRFYRKDGTAAEAKGIRYVAAYDADGNVVPSSGLNDSKSEYPSYTVPAGIVSIVLTFNNPYRWCITRNTEITEFVAYDPNDVPSETTSYFAKPAFVGMASETKPGLVRMWTEELDGETVLHISTEGV